MGKKWKGHLVVLVMGWILVTGFLVGGGGVSVKIWQSVGSTLFCEPLGGMTTPTCPSATVTTNQQANSQQERQSL